MNVKGFQFLKFVCFAPLENVGEENFSFQVFENLLTLPSETSNIKEVGGWVCVKFTVLFYSIQSAS